MFLVACSSCGGEDERAMYETDEQIGELQGLIDRSFAQAGPHLLSIMTPERRLSARQVVRYL